MNTTATEYADTPMTHAYRAIVARRTVNKLHHEFSVKTGLRDIKAQASLIKLAHDACLTATTAAEAADDMASSVTLAGHGGKEWHAAAYDADWIASACIDKVEAMERMHAACKGKAA